MPRKKPGEENLDFLEALRKSFIQLILTRHEQGAAFMAATHGLLTGKPGVCLATLGPGATNLVTGIYFFNTQMGKGVVNETDSRYLGTAALSDKVYIHCAIAHADLVINVGHDIMEKPPFFMEHGGKQVIHVNFGSAIVDNA
ncbi:MAG: thiamine pyrophosphate-binding protein [Desulfuromonadales bacterium]